MNTTEMATDLEGLPAYFNPDDPFSYVRMVTEYVEGAGGHLPADVLRLMGFRFYEKDQEAAKNRPAAPRTKRKLVRPAEQQEIPTETGTEEMDVTM